MKKMKRTTIIIAACLGLAVQVSAQELSLDSCKYSALQYNKTIKEASLHVAESEEVKKAVFTKFFPKVEAQAFAMRSTDYLVDFETSGMNLPVYNGDPATLPTATEFAYVPGMNIQTLDYLNMATVTAIQPIYAGGQIRSGYKLANLGTEVKEESLALNTQQVIVKTEQYYWSLVSLEAKRKTLASYEKLLNTLLNDVQVAFDAGIAEKSDLLKVKLKINEINANKLKLENGIDLLKMALCQHIGIEYSDEINLKDTAFQVVDPLSLYQNPDVAISNRKEYKMLNKSVEAEVLQKRMARGEFLPKLAVGVQAQYLDVADHNNTFGLGFAMLSVPISNWWEGKHKLQEHDIRIDLAKNNLEEKAELISLQMEKAYKELNESYQQIAVSESLMEQAGEHLKVVRDNYKAGIMSTSDLLEAQAVFQEAQDKLVDAKSTYQIQQVLYKQATAQYFY